VPGGANWLPSQVPPPRQVSVSEAQRFGKYQILERIASGGMAEVFKARLEGIGGFHRSFAIKRILPHLTENPEFVDMLSDEARVAGLLNHANIVQILDFGKVDSQYYIAMEYVNGRDLGQLLARCAERGITLPVSLGIYIVIEMLKGLEYAHTRQAMRDGEPVPLNIVHRDVSPANILLSLQGEVKITDFGIAKASVKALQTQSGVIKGRFDYMSPEQASARGVDARSDLFSVGVVLYQLLTNRHPFRKGSELATIEAVRRGSFNLPSSVNADIPPMLDQIVLTSLAVEPKHRYQSATQFKEALDRFCHDVGFMTNAAQLARFLKELLPELDTKKDRDTEELQLDEPRPPENSGNHPAFTTLPDPSTSLDEATLIRQAPRSADWGEIQTVIRPQAQPSAAPSPPPALPPARGEPKSRLVYRTPAYIHFVYLVAVATVLVSGLAGGAVLATWLQRVDPTLVQRAPVLQIHVPANTRVYVNGAALSGSSPLETTVAPGAETILKVEPEGMTPIEAKVNLNYNELRVISFNPVALQPKK
jgi:serine/threonine protein kinase